LKSLTTLLAGFVLFLAGAPRGHAQSAVVDWNNVHQEIDGFGASSANEGLTPAEGKFFFSTGPGSIGLSLMRASIPVDGSCATVNAACAGQWQVSNMKLAIANGAKVWSSSWSPPASMKTNRSTLCQIGASISFLNTNSYAAYANYLANYVKTIQNLYGIPLYALSMQNEPDFCPNTYAGAEWTAANLDTFIKTNLGPTFAAQGLTGTLIMTPESSHWNTLNTLASATMNDPAAAQYVGIIAWHDYDDAATVINPFAGMGKKYWETEASATSTVGPSPCGGCWDPSMADALMWAQIVDNRMAVANANAWHYWILLNGVNDNAGLTGSDGVTIPKRTYMLGNYSKFVRPGFYRIDATHTPQSGVLVSAYRNAASGAVVIVVINQNSSSVSQSFMFNGTNPVSMAPWITSVSLNLAQQPDVAVSSGSFTYTLPAASVTTFVGVTSTPAPSGLQTKVN
jgi:glucuronoarabinoxylan endo-1,4-beta-xylanase